MTKELRSPKPQDWNASRFFAVRISDFFRHLSFVIRHFVLFLLLPNVIAAATAPTRPNIIFILMDDLRWDEIDYPFVKVPNIQRIGREGVKFTNAFVSFVTVL